MKIQIALASSQLETGSASLQSVSNSSDLAKAITELAKRTGFQAKIKSTDFGLVIECVSKPILFGIELHTDNGIEIVSPDLTVSPADDNLMGFKKLSLFIEEEFGEDLDGVSPTDAVPVVKNLAKRAQKEKFQEAGFASLVKFFEGLAKLEGNVSLSATKSGPSPERIAGFKDAVLKVKAVIPKGTKFKFTAMSKGKFGEFAFTSPEHRLSKLEFHEILKKAKYKELPVKKIQGKSFNRYSSPDKAHRVVIEGFGTKTAYIYMYYTPNGFKEDYDMVAIKNTFRRKNTL